MTSQVLVRKPALHGKISRMVPADVIAVDGDKLTVKIGREREVVGRKDVLPLHGASNTLIRSMPSPAKNPLRKF